MTRDEAFEKLTRTDWIFSPNVSRTFDTVEAQKFVSALDALGLLRLDDEPKGPKQRAVEAMFKHSYENQTNGMITPRHAIEAIERAGLQITEKEG